MVESSLRRNTRLILLTVVIFFLSMIVPLFVGARAIPIKMVIVKRDAVIYRLDKKYVVPEDSYLISFKEYQKIISFNF